MSLVAKSPNNDDIKSRHLENAESYVKKNLLKLEEEKRKKLEVADKYSTIAATPQKHKNSLKGLTDRKRQRPSGKDSNYE